jgi:signal transduction histidine kinase
MSAPLPPLEKIPRFLAGGGATAALIAAFDWSKTAAGPIAQWPQSLKAVVGMVVRSPLPMTLLWGQDGLLIYNDGYAVIARARHPAALGSKARESWPEVADYNAEIIRRVLAGESITYRNLELELHRNGAPEQVWLTVDYSPVLNDFGDPAGVLAIVVETTEKIHAERRLIADRERFEQMFQQAPTFMTMLSGHEHRFEFANPGYFKLVAHRPIIGRTVAEALPEAVEQGYVEILDGVFRSGTAFSAIGSKYSMQVTPGGPIQDRFLDFVYQPITDTQGQVIGIFVEGVDVTERVKAAGRREAFVKLTDRFRTLTTRSDIGFAAAETLAENLEVSRVGYGTIDPEAETLHVDRDWTAPGVETLAGTLHLRDYGSFIDSLKANEFIEIADVRLDPRTAMAAAALEGRSARAFVNVPVVEHGRLVAVLYVNHAEARDWSGADLAFIREIAERTWTAAERVRSEAALRESEARLREANETLEAKVEARTRDLMQAEEALRQAHKMEAIGQLTGGIAHDFNNLLAAITGSLEFIEKRIAEGRADTADRFIAGAQGAAKRAAALTQRLLAFSRRQTLDPKPTDLNRLIAGMEDLIRRSVGPNIAVGVAGAAGLWATKVDPSQLENALLNLCINARDAMAPTGGRLTIATANASMDLPRGRERDMAPGDYICLSVADTGTGMEPDVVARAFDPFFTTKPLGEGTGLGLSMVYGFARQSGGQIRIASEIGKGTTMCLYLPRFAGPLHAVEEEAAAVIDKGDGETVLIVDDEQIIRMLAVEVLEEAGYATLEAHDGPSALRLLQSNVKIDLLISDVGLPGGMNGRQVADAARVVRPGLKVIFITGFAESTAFSDGHLGNGMEIMTKPFTMTALGNKVREILEK